MEHHAVIEGVDVFQLPMENLRVRLCLDIIILRIRDYLHQDSSWLQNEPMLQTVDQILYSTNSQPSPLVIPAILRANTIATSGA